MTIHDFISLQTHSVVFVCGLYKSGTSLLTGLIEEKLGFHNPALLSNPNERGYGRAQARYLTRECKTLRQINQEISRSESEATATVARYLKSLTFPVVLKDPMFCQTLKFWLEGAQTARLSAVVIFMHRDENELLESWRYAPFTKSLLEQGGFITMKAGFERQMQYVRQVENPHFEINFKELISIAQSDF